MSRTLSNIAVFHDHELQWVLALFCTIPELYKDYAKHKHRQDYFFEEFRRFASKYYNFSGDERVYFGSIRKEVAGEANICGSVGSVSGASSRYFKNKYRSMEESREKYIDEFTTKYGVYSATGKDIRVFLGVTEIWNKLDSVSSIIANSKWAGVKDLSYDDSTFKTPLPNRLKKELIPLFMRNKAMQKSRRPQFSGNMHSTNYEEDEGETPNTVMCGSSTSSSDDDW